MKVAESPVYQDIIKQKLTERGKQKFFEEYLSEKKPETEETPEEDSSEEKSPVMQYYDFVMDRIKNGEPKYQIGGAAMSVKEWNRLLDKVDECIDGIKEEQEERKDKLEKKKAEEYGTKEEQR